MYKTTFVYVENEQIKIKKDGYYKILKPTDELYKSIEQKIKTIIGDIYK